MNNITSIIVIGQYEWKRALARKRVLLLIIFTIFVELLPFIILNLLPLPSFLESLSGWMWFIGAMIPHSFFLQFVALLIGSGATSEEYEQGTADIILTKPISKTSYMIGKFVGGYTLFSFIALLTTLLSVILSLSTFGEQFFLEYAPIVYLSIITSTLVFFSFGFFAGEILRSPGLAYLVSTSFFITSFILGPFLSVANSLTGDIIYLELTRILPTWSVQSFPQMLAENLFLGSTNIPFLSSFSPEAPGSLLDATIGIIGYSTFGVLLSFTRFLKTDVTKKSIE